MYTMEYDSAIKIDEILPFLRLWMELVGIVLSEVTQEEKNKHCMISFIRGLQKDETEEQIKLSKTNTRNLIGESKLQRIRIGEGRKKGREPHQLRCSTMGT